MLRIALNGLLARPIRTAGSTKSIAGCAWWAIRAISTSVSAVEKARATVTSPSSGVRMWPAPSVEPPTTRKYGMPAAPR